MADPAFDREACKQRNTAERCIKHPKRWRGIVTRYYYKTATVYLAGLYGAEIFRSARRSKQNRPAEERPDPGIVERHSVIRSGAPRSLRIT